jgi:hypothetical protein
MASTIYNPLAQEWLQILLDTPCYAALHFEVPSEDDTGASEVDGLSYARCSFIWTATASLRTLVNNSELEWLNLEATTIVGIGAWDAPTGGNLLLFHQLDQAKPIADLGSYRLDARQLYVTL